ncbi:alpha/beta-hydrolase [Thozetella sp. PMI_491]|nr:alpha/beta-hydrolase [Thozetella sp. PMI_491]
MAKPSIVFIPGSYTPLRVYQSLFEAISKEGYEIDGIHPPTVGPSSGEGANCPAPSMYDDAAAIAQHVEKLADQGKDVIVMGHSYAGVPMSQCTEGLGKAERSARGKSGGIVQLAYMACLVPAIGHSAATLLSRVPDDKRPAICVDEYGWMMPENPAAAAEIVCQCLPSKEGEEMIRSFAKHSAQSFGNVLTYAGYKNIPTSYLLCEKDLAGPPEFQREMISMIEETSGRKVDVTSIEADHFPHLSQEKGTVDWALKLARKTQERQ